MIQLKISDVDQTSLLEYNTLNINDSISERSTANFQLIDKNDTTQGFSLDFDGVNQYARADNEITSYPFTFETWVKIDVLNIVHVVMAISNITVGNISYEIRVSATNRFVIRSQGFATTTGATTIVANTWYHVALVFESNTAKRLYVNGILDATQTSNVSFSNTANNRVFFSRNRLVDTPNYLNGKLSDVRIWNTARTVVEILDNYKKRLTGTELGLVGYWKLQENDALTAKDYTSNANNATLFNSPTWVTGQPFLMSFVEGEEVLIYDDSLLVFGGTIFYPKKFNPFQTNILVHDIDCVDFNEIADRFIVAESYLNQLTGYVIDDIYNKYLASSGVTIGEIQDGIIIESAKFPRVSTVTQVFDELAEFNGFIWYIDYNKELYFVERSYNDTLQTIDNNSLIRNVQVKFNKSQLRNRQFIRGGKSETGTISLENPTPKPDNVSKIFFTRFPVSDKPRIFIDSVEVSSGDIGVNGKDSGKKWYYQVDNNGIVQDDSETTLNTEILQITYTGLFPLLVVAEDPASILNRTSIEGGTGIYESIETDATIVRADFGLNVAKSKLLKYSERQIEIVFDSFTPLYSGDLITFNFPIYDINQKVLIDEVEASEFSPDKFIYKVHAVSGESFGSWVQFFKNISRKPDKIIIRDDEVLVVLSTAFEIETWGEDTTVSVFVCSFPSDSLFPDDTLFPC
jgi:hypothetical protein